MGWRSALFGVLAVGLGAVSAQARLAKAEPAYGCYFAAFIGPDWHVENLARISYRPPDSAFSELLHKRLAVQWQYFKYEHPEQLLDALEDAANWHSTLEVALEPRDLSEVKDDGLLQKYAGMLAAYGRPIFLRFAGEMNGAWTRYHRDPALYKHKFKLVHDVMAKRAPNVVMIWCVSNEPQRDIEAFYPGDAYVDWVGVDFYSVLHHNNNVHESGENESPAAMLGYVYHHFASRKPICICEYGASHRDRLQPDVDRSEWAGKKISALLAALPRKYPRVKMVGLFNVRTQIDGYRNPTSSQSDYCFTEDRYLRRVVARAIAPHYFLTRVQDRSGRCRLPPGSISGYYTVTESSSAALRMKRRDVSGADY